MVEIVNKSAQMNASKEARSMLQILAGSFMTATRTEYAAPRGFRREPRGQVPAVRARWAGHGW
jgi:hypothetical protein